MEANTVLGIYYIFYFIQPSKDYELKLTKILHYWGFVRI